MDHLRLSLLASLVRAGAADRVRSAFHPGDGRRFGHVPTVHDRVRAFYPALLLGAVRDPQRLWRLQRHVLVAVLPLGTGSAPVSGTAAGSAGFSGDRTLLFDGPGIPDLPGIDQRSSADRSAGASFGPESFDRAVRESHRTAALAPGAPAGTSRTIVVPDLSLSPAVRRGDVVRDWRAASGSHQSALRAGRRCRRSRPDDAGATLPARTSGRAAAAGADSACPPSCCRRGASAAHSSTPAD